MDMLALLGGFTIGEITIPYAWIGVFLGVYLGTQFMKWHVQRTSIQQGQQISELLFSIVLVGVLGWKFSNLLLNPMDAIRNPLSMLAIPGSTYAGEAGLLVALTYGSYKWWRLKPIWRSVIDIWPIGLVAGGAVTELFWLSLGKTTHLPWGVHAYGQVYQPTNFYESMVLWVSLAIVWKMRVRNKGSWLLIFVGIGSLLVSITTVNTWIIIGLSPGQWVALVLALLGIISVRENDRRQIV